MCKPFNRDVDRIKHFLIDASEEQCYHFFGNDQIRHESLDELILYHEVSFLFSRIDYTMKQLQSLSAFTRPKDLSAIFEQFSLLHTGKAFIHVKPVVLNLWHRAAFPKPWVAKGMLMGLQKFICNFQNLTSETAN